MLLHTTLTSNISIQQVIGVTLSSSQEQKWLYNPKACVECGSLQTKLLTIFQTKILESDSRVACEWTTIVIQNFLNPLTQIHPVPPDLKVFTDMVNVFLMYFNILKIVSFPSFRCDVKQL